MEADRQHGHGHGQSSDFSSSPWMEVGSFPSQQSPPFHDYHGFGYGPSSVVSMESSFGITMPPPYTSLPITMSPHTWPSMLATHTPFPESGLPSTSAPPPESTPAPAPPPRKTSTGGSTPRRTLTDEDRRQMCLYHEENKTAKQTDIGMLFGVERSTVSKVLRQKEKYLNPDDGSRSPVKRTKGKVPDIEKALSNWARNYQRQGFWLTDEAIREKAFMFANTCGHSEGKSRVLSTNWVERFKQKYSLANTKPRKASFDNRSESESPIGLMANPLGSAVQSPSSVSPTTSANGIGSPSTLSHGQSQDNMGKELTDSLVELAGGCHHTHSKSMTSIDTSPSFSTSLTSPSSTLVSDSPFTPTSQSRIPSTDSNSSRPRSQTFPVPMVEPCLMPGDESLDKISSIAPTRQLPLSMLDSPLEEEPSPKTTTVVNTATTNTNTNNNTVKRNRSNPEIRTKSIHHPPTFSKSNTVSPVSSPGSPTRDDAQHALETVLSYFRNQPTGIAPQDYFTIGKLMERLKLAQSQSQSQSQPQVQQNPNTNPFPGSLPPIDELDDVPHVSKKRSIHDLTWS